MIDTATRNDTLVLPERRLWTRREYERMAELGLFGPEDKVELIEGEIVAKMASMYTPHATAVILCDDALRQAFHGGQTHLRVQMPFAASDNSEPEPGIAVVPGGLRAYEDSHPASALLLVEVADSSLSYDRVTKAALYARAGVPEYWILNLVDRLLEVHRQPQSIPERPLGHGYASVAKLAETQTVTPLAAFGTVITVADLLPRRRHEA
jgi:Uma2 family endonuclease